MAHWLEKSRRIEIMTPREPELRQMSRQQLIEYRHKAIQQRERWADHLTMTLKLSPQLRDLDATETDPVAFVRVQINGWNSTIELVNETLAIKSG